MFAPCAALIATFGLVAGWPLAAAAQGIVPVPGEAHARAVDCLALAIAYEAGNESPAGQRAVADVVLNRVRSAGFPKSVCGVVFEGAARHTGCQFTFTCDGALRRHLPDRMITTAQQVAEAALAESAPIGTNGATHYHAAYVYPYWAPRLVRLTQIGAHIFYRRAGATADFAGTPSARPQPAPIGSDRPVFAPWGLAASAPAAPETP